MHESAGILPLFAASTSWGPEGGASWTMCRLMVSVELSFGDSNEEGECESLPIECSNQGRPLVSATVLVDIIRAKLLMRVMVVLGCLSKR